MASRRSSRKVARSPRPRRATARVPGKARPKRQSSIHLPVVVEQDEDGVFIVSVPTLQGCRSYGYTLDEAMANVAEAAMLCLEDEKPGANGNRFIGLRDLEIVR